MEARQRHHGGAAATFSIAIVACTISAICAGSRKAGPALCILLIPFVLLLRYLLVRHMKSSFI